MATTRTSFSDSIALAASRERQQMWRAAQTVRAHVAAGEQRDDVLACLGLTQAESPTVDGCELSARGTQEGC
jgi:hypothetical protein